MTYTKQLALILPAAILALVLPATVAAQGRGGGRGGAPVTAKAEAPIDLTGYWTAVITEDWHQRMLTAEKGDFGTGAPGAVTLPGGRPGPSNIPFNPNGRKVALAWDPAKDEAAGEACRAYGAVGVLRQPTHLHITWQDDNTLKMEADFGQQTRLLHFAQGAMGAVAMKAPAGEAPSWQGYSVANWKSLGGKPGFDKGGNLGVVTTNLKPGYYYRNGLPYSGNAVLTEHFRVIDIPESGQWISFSSMVVDPEYLTQPYIVTYQFKKLPDGSKWKPQPCEAR
jgi:hypothetical protein